MQFNILGSLFVSIYEGLLNSLRYCRYMAAAAQKTGLFEPVLGLILLKSYLNNNDVQLSSPPTNPIMWQLQRYLTLKNIISLLK